MGQAVAFLRSPSEVDQQGLWLSTLLLNHQGWPKPGILQDSPKESEELEILET